MSSIELTIKNYQIIKNADLIFNPGLTLITGKSNNGKSSIFKAFQQAVYNNPGTSFIRHGQTTSTIEIKHPNYILTYSKSTNGGKAVIQDANGTEQFTKLGSQQLPQIKDITHIDKELNYNFWSQLEKPFLISLPPRQQFDLIQNSPYSLPINNCMDNIIHDRKALQQSQLKHQSQLEIIQQQSNQFKSQLTNLPLLTTLNSSVDTLQSKFDTLHELNNLLSQYTSINITPIQQRLNSLTTIPPVNPNLKQQLDSITSVYTTLTKTVQPINDIHSKQSHIDKSIHHINTILNTYFQVCPFCNRPFDQNHN